MRYITPEELEIFEQSRDLEDKWREAEKNWLEEVKRTHAGEITYTSTKPAFDKYIKLFNKWKKFRDNNAEILFAQTLN